ncbi:hypothetical protein BC826DRAFT_547801 [Russula brevipes]|nr:hypothetical protein BC826DRAFT_547801 [Russula brevipes]
MTQCATGIAVVGLSLSFSDFWCLVQLRHSLARPPEHLSPSCYRHILVLPEVRRCGRSSDVPESTLTAIFLPLVQAL